MRFAILLTLTALVLATWRPATSGQPKDSRGWVEPMKKVHTRFTGTKGTLACFGDSITVSMAFWAPLAYEPKKMPPAMAKAHALVKSHMKPGCWNKWRGPEFGNQGSMTIRWAHDNVDAWLKKLNPEAAVIMFGSNDLGEVGLEEYDKKTREVVDRCLQNGTVVLLTTLPPRSGRFEQARSFAAAVRKIAADKHVPLVDYFREIVERRPEDWDGALPKFKSDNKDVYQVPTLISGDGVHPSNPKNFQDYTDESLRSNGFALRNYLTLMAYADVIQSVLKGKD